MGHRHAWASATPGCAPGSSHQYRVVVTDPFGNVANSPWTSVTVAATGADSTYLKAVYASQPTNYWRMGEADRHHRVGRLAWASCR